MRAISLRWVVSPSRVQRTTRTGFAVDWTKQQPQILEYYTAVLKLDTSTPPGNETLAVNYLKPILDRAGIPNQVFSLDPKRGNLVARLNGNGTQGTHDELMAKGGQYSELYGIQAAAYR